MLVSNQKNNQAKSLQSHQSYQKWFRLLNIILILWSLTQIFVYVWQVTLVSCKQVKNLVIGYIINYVLYALVPIFSIVAFSCYPCFININMVYSGMNIIIKIVCIVIIMTVGWRHVGMCYIHKTLKIIIICMSSSQILVLLAQIFILNKKRIINNTVNAVAKSSEWNTKKIDEEISYQASVTGKEMLQDSTKNA